MDRAEEEKSLSGTTVQPAASKTFPLKFVKRFESHCRGRSQTLLCALSLMSLEIRSVPGKLCPGWSYLGRLWKFLEFTGESAFN